MEVARSTQPNGMLLKRLFEGGTSHNGQKEILEAFRHVDAWEKASQVCSFYQGCGSDLVTLAFNSIDTHILSDEKSTVADQLAVRLQKLADANFILDLQCGEALWTFEHDGRRKTVHFTTHPIDQLNFIEQFKRPLGAVFEWNCGDSARKQSFWQAIKRELIDGGYVLGSYASDLITADRVAFVLDTNGEESILQGVDYYDNVDPSVRNEVLDAARKLNRIPEKPLDRNVVEIQDRTFALCWAGSNHFAVSTVWRQPVSAFGLQLTSHDERVCTLMKQTQANT